jgi:hypothetical protein
MKNIILISLAIIFLVFITSYVFHVKTEGMSINNFVNNNPNMTTELLNTIDATLNLESTIPNDPNGSGVTTTNIMTILMRLPITDSKIKEIFKDSSIVDSEKIKKIRKIVKHWRQRISENGLILHYTMDEIQSDGTILNIAAETMENLNFNGKVYGATIDNSNYRYGKGSMRFKYDSSKHFNVTDYIRIPTIPRTFYQNSNFLGFTFATWYQTTSNSKPWARLFEFAVGEYGNHSILASTNLGNSFNYTFCNFGESWNNFNLISSKDTLPKNTWIHIATTISPDGIYTNYYNGVKMQSNYSIEGSGENNSINSNSIVWMIDPNTQALRVPKDMERNANLIGKSVWWNGDGGFDGWMNDFRIYRKELTSDNILEIYNLGKKPKQVYSNNMLIHFSAKNNNGINVIQNTDRIIWNDISQHNNNAYSSDSNISYCPKNEKITIPSGSWLEITNNTFGSNSYTIAIVANIKSFNPAANASGIPANYLIGSNGCSGRTFYFTNNYIHFGESCSANLTNFDLTSHLNMGIIKHDAINIFIIKIDSDYSVSISINGIKLDLSNPILKDYLSDTNIRIGRDIDGPYYSTNDFELYEFMYFPEYMENEQQQMIEGSLAENWGLVNNLPADHSYHTSK